MSNCDRVKCHLDEYIPCNVTQMHKLDNESNLIIKSVYVFVYWCLYSVSYLNIISSIKDLKYFYILWILTFFKFASNILSG